MFMTKPEAPEKYRGLVWGTIADALNRYKGSDKPRRPAAATLAKPLKLDREEELRGEGKLCVVHISKRLATSIDAGEGDLLYISDTRWWLGGLRSSHAVVGKVEPSEENLEISMGPDTYAAVVLDSRVGMELSVERFY